MDNVRAERESAYRRKKRVKRIKNVIIIILIICLLFPTLLCMILFGKIYSLEKKIDKLTENQVGMEEKSSKTFEKNLYYQAEDYSSSLEESDKNSYNEEEISAANPSVANSAQTDGSKDTGEGSGDSKEAAAAGSAAGNAGNQAAEKSAIDSLKENDKKQDGKTQQKDSAALSSARKNMDEKERKKYEGKEVYLTFDDGPSSYTDDILDILDKYQVKATFFVIGKTDEQSKELYKRIVEDGHSIGMHSYSHDYNQIYKSLKAFESDFKRIRKLIYDTTGFKTDLYRFPGGSGNEVSSMDMSVFIRYLNKENVVYYDWNVASGDATGTAYTPEQLADNALEGIAEHTRSIVLMHDTDRKLNTVRSLDAILQTLTENGAKLLTLDDTVKPIQQVSISSSELYNK